MPPFFKIGVKASQLAIALVIVAIIGSAAYAGFYLLPGGGPSSSTASPGKVQVVAAENFWGSLASQLGGDKANVLSIVSDPNADPHEYSSNAADAAAIVSASLVIVNGAGYDTWALSIVAASDNPHQTLLNVQLLLGKPLGVNPHFWYSPYYVNTTIRTIYKDLVSIDPADGSYFRQRYAALNASIGGPGGYDSRIKEIASKFAGTRVAATEDIFVYLANATRLDLVSPAEFMQAVAEGSDPSAASVAEFQAILQNKSVALLVYNQQTVNPLTSSIKAQATQNGIPVVGVTETIQPPDLSFQDWMNSQVVYIQNALNANALGQ